MKTLADVKRKMTLGSKWRCVRLFEGGKVHLCRIGVPEKIMQNNMN